MHNVEFILNHFIEVLLTYKKLHVLKYMQLDEFGGK